LLAFAVLLGVFGLVQQMFAEPADRASRRIAWVLAGLVLVQPILGVEAWMRRFGTGDLPELMHSSLALDLARSGHHVLGTLIFSTTVALAVLLHRRSAAAAVEVPLAPSGRMEGAA
jgi:hypothetical protein